MPTLNFILMFSFALCFCAQAPCLVLTEFQLLDCTTSFSNDESLDNKPQGCSHSSLDSNPSNSTLARKLGFKKREVGGEERNQIGTASVDCPQEQVNKQLGGQASIFCSPRINTSSPSSLNKPLALPQQKLAPIEVYIKTPNNETRFDLGSSLTLECRFNTNLKDLRFDLRWLRSVIGSSGINQSIAGADTDDSSMTIIVATTKIWTVPRNGGLDLELNDLQAADSGDYYCQAVSRESDSNILSSAKIHLSPLPNKQSDSSGYADSKKSFDEEQVWQTRGYTSTSKPTTTSQGYSQDNLSKILPSLKIIPEFSEVAQGESAQLICVTNELDPDPDPSEISWSFEPIDRSKSPFLVSNQQHQENQDANLIRQLPNITILGNVLVVWSMSAIHCGLYRCSVDLVGFNLTVQATGELALRPSLDSAPLVYVLPELIRLSPNSSATIQCEATGYPPPSIIWYRVDGHQQYQLASSGNSLQSQFSELVANADADASITAAGSANELKIDGIEFEQIAYKDSMAYCDLHKCFVSKYQQHPQVTGISLIHLSGARAAHQGQYVCRANNKHGSNQASSVIDIEFREPPMVEIGQQYKEQTIVLPAETTNSDQKVSNQQQSLNVTFKCTIKSGRPHPKLRWIRTARNNNKLLNGTILDNQSIGANNKNLDIYDLTKVSSVTSNVSVYTEDAGKSLVLVISTISLDDEGDYVCLGENEWGRHSDLARLYVREPVLVKIPQSSPLVAHVNDSFHLDCLASGYPLPLDIEWSRSDRGAFFSLISRTSSNNGLHSSQERAMLKFDRVNIDESGEYTCNARDPLNPAIILRDTIMVVVEDSRRLPSNSESDEQRFERERAAQQPKLMVRPTKVNAPLGSNVTLDCLTVSGLQPTIVEWIGPPQLMEGRSLQSNHSSFGGESDTHAIGRPYNRASLATTIGGQLPVLQQFGSKLKIFNVSKAHEGVYQCKGSNKVGVENAPALIKVLDDSDLSDRNSGPDLYPNGHAEFLPNYPGQSPGIADGSDVQQAKTKVARLGLNIELKCQVNGVDQPATSWSREGLELPASSVQIGHNLWIQNVTQKDNGLYICSARSKQPNKVIQAKINLLVQGDSDEATMSKVLNLSAKIVASKSQVAIGDSITLECIISQPQPQQQQNQSSSQQSANNNKSSLKQIDFEEIERNVVWTNLHSGQSLFQDNVYIQNNLLIIYELRPENSATYRCNYNDLMQHTDYNLQVLSSAGDQSSPPTALGSGDSVGQDQGKSAPTLHSKQGNENVTYLAAKNGRSVERRQVALGSRVKLDCPLLNGTTSLSNPAINYYWTKGSGEESQLMMMNGPIVFDSVSTRNADIYHCHLSTLQQKPLAELGGSASDTVVGVIEPQSILLNVLVPVAKFVQRPVSFVTLPAISGANQQLELELKFLPERENGLILFSGQQQPNQRSSAPSGGDYISLGLNRGYMEFRFELGDGTTLLRSFQSLALNQWHKVLIERNKRGAVMYLDKQPPVSNSSIGKFFNLNLDSVLYVGGHQYFLTSSSNMMNGNRTTSSATINNLQQQQPSTLLQQGRNNGKNGNGNRHFYGYSRGFQGCISLLRISRQQINLMARNRSVALGVYECDKPECKQQDHCEGQNGVCQIDRLSVDQLGAQSNNRYLPMIDSTRRVSPSAEVRCICLPGLAGDRCERFVSSLSTDVELLKNRPSSTIIGDETTYSKSQRTNSIGGACDLLKPCASNGTLKCQSFTSTSYKCHCRIGFMGPTCALTAEFSGYQTSVWFNQQAYLHFRFNRPEESIAYLRNKLEQSTFNPQQAGWLSPSSSTEATATTTATKTAENEANSGNIDSNFFNLSSFNATKFNLLTQMTEVQNISFKLQTKSSYGLIFYTGLATAPDPARGQSHPSRWDSLAGEGNSQFDGSSSLIKSSMTTQKSTPTLVPTPAPPMQTSKSVVANLLSRLSSMVFDYLAIALVDGHAELSYELGSGVAIIRSSQRVNDGKEHQIRVIRQGKFARLIIDGKHKHEGSAPGKLWLLNSQPDIYLGGLPHLAELTNNMYMSGFTGCLSELEINSLGPLNLINSDHLTQVLSARNLAPCNISASSATSTATTTTATAITALTTQAPADSPRPATRAYRYSTPKSSDDDDSDDP